MTDEGLAMVGCGSVLPPVSWLGSVRRINFWPNRTHPFRRHIRGVIRAYATLTKIYGKSESPDTRYSPAVCLGCERKSVSGSPDPDLVSTSYVESANVTMRMPATLPEVLDALRTHAPELKG